MAVEGAPDAGPALTVVGPNKGRVYAVRFGEETWSGRIEDPPSAKLAAWLARVGLDAARLLVAVPREVEGPPPAPVVARWWRRGLREPRGAALEVPIEALGDTLLTALTKESEHPEEVFEWENLDAAAVLDLDDLELAPLEVSLVPAPLARWASHSGRGLHAFYAATAGFPARELAAAAGLLVARRDPRAGVEVLPRTRHPAALRSGRRAGPVLVGSTDPFALAKALRGEAGLAEDGEVDAWLDARGLRRGGRYGHDRCPGDPSDTTGAPPVVVGDDGIVCHRCRATGKGGWWPWGRLLGIASERGPWSWLAEAARSLAATSHAALVLAEAAPTFPARLRPDAYAALLRACHDPEDPRVLDARIRSYRLVRGEGLWLDAETFTPVLPAVGVEVTRDLPSARWARRLPDGEWEGGPDPIRHDRHRTDQRVDGYVPVRPVRGIRLWGRHRPYPGREALRATVTSDALYPPAYVPADERPPVEEAEAEILGQLPGLDLGYFRLLLLARAYAERGDGPVPMVVVTGVTGAGKTTTAFLAAAACGDRAELVRHDDPGRFAEAIGVGAQQAGILLADEFAKGLRPRERIEAFSRWLDLRRHYTYRRLRVGPVTVSIDAAIVITDTDLGEEIRTFAQVARRLVHVRLPRRAEEWTKTMRVGAVESARRDPALARALDVFLSDFADRWLAPGEGGDWWAAARTLGYRRLEEEAAAREEGIPTAALVRELWIATAGARDAGPPWVGAGWKMLDPATEQGSRLFEAWAALCDGEHPEQLSRVRRVREIDLGSALGFPFPVDLQTAPHRGRIGFRWLRLDTGEAMIPEPEERPA